MTFQGVGPIILREGAQGQEVLLMYRDGTSTFNHQWSNPGGGVEENETLEAAVARETLEEIGVEVSVGESLGVFDYVIGGELRGQFTGFLASIVSGEPRICEPNKASALRYWPLNNLPENLAPYTSQYLSALK